MVSHLHQTPSDITLANRTMINLFIYFSLLSFHKYIKGNKYLIEYYRQQYDYSKKKFFYKYIRSYLVGKLSPVRNTDK